MASYQGAAEAARTLSKELVEHLGTFAIALLTFAITGRSTRFSVLECRRGLFLISIVNCSTRYCLFTIDLVRMQSSVIVGK